MLAGNEGVHKQKEDGRRGQCEHNSVYKWKQLRYVCATLAFSSQASVSMLIIMRPWIGGRRVGNDSERKMKVERGDVVPASRLARRWAGRLAHRKAWEWPNDRESVEQVHLCCKKSASAKPIAKFRIHLAIAKKAGATKGAANTEVRV